MSFRPLTSSQAYWLRDKIRHRIACRYTHREHRWEPRPDPDAGAVRSEWFRDLWRAQFAELRSQWTAGERGEAQAEAFRLADAGKRPPESCLQPWAGLFWREKLRDHLTYQGGPVLWAFAAEDPRAPHVDPENPARLCYVANFQDGLRGKTVSCKPGRYLTRFCPELGAEKIQQLAVQWHTENVDIPLLLATTADDIEHVYRHGPPACMSKSFATPEHPSRVYAAGDLAIAYIGTDDSIIARALVWPKKQLYGRIYGCRARLTKALDRAGYSEGSLTGARIRKIPYSRGYVMPYIDGPCEGVDDHGDCFVLSERPTFSARTETGYLALHTCNHCDTGCSETSTISGSEWCETCVEIYSSRCEHCDNHYPDGSECSECRPLCEDHKVPLANGACAVCSADLDLAATLPGEFVPVAPYVPGTRFPVPGYVPPGSFLAVTYIEGEWYITHVPSGLSAKGGIATLANALRILGQLHPTALDWNFQDPSEWMPGHKEKLSGWVRAAV